LADLIRPELSVLEQVAVILASDDKDAAVALTDFVARLFAVHRRPVAASERMPAA
jgi:hypothetical protein